MRPKDLNKCTSNNGGTRLQFYGVPLILKGTRNAYIDHCIVRPLHYCTLHPTLELQDPLVSMPWSVSFLLSKLFSSISFVQNNRAPRRHHHSPHYLLDIKMLQGWMIGSVGSIAMDGADTGDAPAWCRQTVNWFRYLHTFVAEHTMNVNKHI